MGPRDAGQCVATFGQQRTALSFLIRHAELVSASIVPSSSSLDGKMDAETSSA
jgi:hypothetical protein